MPVSKLQEKITNEIFSHYFKMLEFACPCCGRRLVSVELLNLLEAIRCKAKCPIIIHGPQGGGYRCPDLMAKMIAEGKTNETSLHSLGEAADIHANRLTPKQLYAICDELNPNGGVGRYHWGVHVDTGKGKGKRRWGA